MVQTFATRRSFILGLVAALAAFAVRAKEEASGETFMWKASSPTNTVYLLGSIHVANESFYPLAPEIEAAFAASKKLVVEANVDAGDEMQANVVKLITAKGVYLDGGSLSKRLSKPTVERVKSYCEKSGMFFQMMDKSRPWFFIMTVTATEMQRIGMKAEFGIDLHFLKAAKDHKPILELESIEAQFDLMSGLSDDLQEKWLVQTLSEMPEVKTKADKMIRAWKTGDAPALEELMFNDSIKKHPELKPLFAKLLDERNGPMAEKIDGYLKSGEIHFVVVGAGHLIGENGLVSLLKKKGYTLEQVQTRSKPK